MINVTLYQNDSEANKIGKDLTTILTMSGNLRDEIEVTQPVLYVEADNPADIITSNYMYIPEFYRYYFITNIRCVRNKIYELSGRVDVLESFKDTIKTHKAIIERSKQGKFYNKRLTDNAVRLYSNPIYLRRHSGFNKFVYSDNTGFILAVAGGYNPPESGGGETT